MAVVQERVLLFKSKSDEEREGFFKSKGSGRAKWRARIRELLKQRFSRQPRPQSPSVPEAAE